MISSATTLPPGAVTRRISASPARRSARFRRRKADADAAEAPVRERQRQRVAGEEPDAPLPERPELRLAEAQHPLDEVDAHDAAHAGLPEERQGEVARAGGEVEGEGPRRRRGEARGGPPPHAVAPARHQRVHEVVARRDAREHRLHARGLVAQYHRPATAATNVMTLM